MSEASPPDALGAGLEASDPVRPPQWASGTVFERILREAPADGGLPDDLAHLREQTVPLIIASEDQRA
jgi:hypothetical protein